MNERIKELALQAGLISSEHNGFDPTFLTMSQKKFAELIVRECANVAADHDALDIYEEIREHFGVKQ